MAHTLRGAIANFQQHPDNIEKQHKTRERAMRAFEFYLDGGDMNEFAEKHGIHFSTAKVQVADVARLIYFREPDREKVAHLKPLVSSVKKNMETWRALYESNKDRVRLLTPPEK